MMAVLWTLLRRHWQAVAIAALALVLMAACHQRDEGLKREGAMRAQLVVLEQKHTRDSVTDVVRTTVVQVDTQRLRKVLTTYDTLRSTLNITDTVAVKAFVLSADSTVKQCRETVGHLLSACAAKDSVITDLRGILALRVAPTAAPSVSLKQKVFWTIVGAGLGELAHRIPP